MQRFTQSFSINLRWILVAFVALCLIYAWATPIFEASDELWHFGLVDTIADTGELPVQNPDVSTAWEQEGSQPPLYYLISAALVSPIDRSDINSLWQPNPHAKAGIPGASDNKNLVLHDSPHPPLKKTALAVYVVRLFSIALGVVTVSMVYVCAEMIGGKRTALLAAGLTAFNPMFLFITASVNNDNLVTALNSVVIYLMLRLLRDGFNTRRSILIAVLIALASLSKLSGLVLVPAVALAALWVAYHRRDWRGLVTLGALMAGIWLVVAGWWYLRNLNLYHELFGTQMMVAVAGPRVGDFTFQTLLDEFQGFRIAYWGLFGAVNIQTFEWFYVLMDVVVLVALAGLARQVWLKRADREYLARIGLLGFIIAIGAVSVITWTAQTYASQGRLLFPFVAATSTLLAVGISGWHIQTWRAMSLQNIGIALLAGFALIVPVVSILPEYAPPKPRTTIPDSVTRLDIRFGDIALIGYETPDRRYQPGDDVPVKVYWQIIRRAERDYSLFLTLLDGDGQHAIGKIDSYPGAGRLRTSTWQLGAIYADFYRIPLSDEATGQFKLRMQVGWWDYPTETYIPVSTLSGDPLEAAILNVGGFAEPDTEVELLDMMPTEPVEFGDVIKLTGYRLDGDRLTLSWTATGKPDNDYTVFVQVLNVDNTIIGQGDAPPTLPTHYWRSGEHYVTEHTLYYPEAPDSGTYPVVIGWYRAGDFARLGANYADNAYPLTTITIP